MSGGRARRRALSPSHDGRRGRPRRAGTAGRAPVARRATGRARSTPSPRPPPIRSDARGGRRDVRRAGSGILRHRAAPSAWCGCARARRATVPPRRPCRCAISRYVVSLPPVTVTRPASLVRMLWRRDRSAVRAESAPFTSGRSPAHTPVTSSRVIVVVSAWLRARSTYSRSASSVCGSSSSPAKSVSVVPT